MNNQNQNNKLFTTLITIGLVGLVLMFTVIFSHENINAQFSYTSTAVEAEILTEPELKPIPEEVLETILSSDMNIMGLEKYNKSREELTPAFKFLRDITSSKFLIQK